MPAVLDAVLFDLDGTLTDPEEGITGSFRKAMAAVGHPLADDADLRWMISPTLAESLGRAGLPEEHHQTVIDAYRQHLRTDGLFQAQLIDGVAAVLDGLRADGVRLALASAKMIDMGETTLAHFGLLDRFELVAADVASPHVVVDAAEPLLETLGRIEEGVVLAVGHAAHRAVAVGTGARPATLDPGEPGEPAA